MKWLSFFIPLLVISPAAWGAPTVACHCFQERGFDPSRPSAADPYIAATAQNSFFAAVYAVPKKDVVRQKMAGVTADDLWIAYALAQASELDGGGLLEAMDRSGGWPRTLSETGLRVEYLDAGLKKAIHAGDRPADWAAAIVDQAAERFLALPVTQARLLRKTGFGHQEIILSGFLALRLAQDPGSLAREIREGKSTWGLLLQRSGMDPKELGPVFNQLVQATQE